MGVDSNFQITKKLTELDVKIDDFKDQIKVINNKLDAMTKMYARVLSELKIQEYKKEDDEPKHKKKIRVSKKKIKH